MSSQILSMPVDLAIKEFNSIFSGLHSEVKKAIVGQDLTVPLSLTALFAGGHVLLEGAPGVGKTLLVRSMSKVLGLGFQRIQFTSDLMPADITGTQIITEGADGRREFQFKQGPIFTQLLLADEINRAGPKTQSALLEAMEEKQVTVLGTTHILPKPFFVLATQNPIELEGTYPLPEAQLDRFMFKLHIPSPNSDEIKEILDRTTGSETPILNQILPKGREVETIQALQTLARKVVLSSSVKDFLVGILSALNPENSHSPKTTRQYVRFAPGPRGAQAIILGSKVRALIDNRMNVSTEDIKQVLLPALRHRLVLQFQAEADGMTSDQIIKEVARI